MTCFRGFKHLDVMIFFVSFVVLGDARRLQSLGPISQQAPRKPWFDGSTARVGVLNPCKYRPEVDNRREFDLEDFQFAYCALG